MTDDEVMQRLKETCILLYSTDGLPGTGYVVALGFAATANHVVKSWTDDVWYPVMVGWPAVREGTEAKVIKRNEAADVAVLVLKGCDDISPIPIGDLPTARTAWTAFGFPSAAAVNGVAVGLPMSGTVHDAKWQNECAQRKILLNSDQAAAGLGTPLHGWSGSPVVANGRLVGHLTEQFGDIEDRSRPAFGMAKASPIDAICILLGAIGGDFSVVPPVANARYDVKAPHVRRLRDIQQHYLGHGGIKPAFVGRDAQLSMLDIWLADESSPANLLLVGAAALGKTSLILNWLQDTQADKQGWRVVFLPISVRFGTNTPDVFWSMAANRMAQLAGLEFDTPRTQLAEVFLDISLEALDRLHDMGQRLLLVIDGLDESTGWKIDQRLLMGSRSGVRRLITTRAVGGETAAVDRWLQMLGWRRGRQTKVVELLPLSKSAVVEAVKDYVMRHDWLGDSGELGAEIWRLSVGDPLLLGYYLDDLAQSSGNADIAAQLAVAQPGFANYFANWVYMQKPNWLTSENRADQLDGLLAVLTCAHGPLVISDLEALLALSFEIKTPLSTQRLQALNRFIIETTEGWTLAHPRLQTHLSNEFSVHSGWISRSCQAFVDWGRDVCNGNPYALRTRVKSGYLARYYALHLSASDVPAADFMLLASASWARLSLLEDNSGRQLTLDLDVAKREVGIRSLEHDPLLTWLYAILLMRSSVVSRAQVPPELLSAYVHLGLASLAHVLRRLELMPAGERAIGLVLLTDQLDSECREELLEQAFTLLPSIQDIKQQMSAWAMILKRMPVSPKRSRMEEAFFGELNSLDSMYSWLEAVDLVAPSLSLQAQRQLLHWSFSQVKECSPSDWFRLDAMMPHLDASLNDEAISLAIAVTKLLRNPPVNQSLDRFDDADRTIYIDDQALPFIFRALSEHEQQCCWHRVHAVTQGSDMRHFRILGLALVFPWLEAAGRQNEIRDQLVKFHAEYSNIYAKSETLTRFARGTRQSELANLALELAITTILGKLKENDSDPYLYFVVDLLDETQIEKCFLVAMQASGTARWKAVAQLAARLSPAQLQIAHASYLQIGDLTDALTTLCALHLEDKTDVEGLQLRNTLQALHIAKPETGPCSLLKSTNTDQWDQRFGVHLPWLAGGEDALMIARPSGSVAPQELWAAIQRQKNSGSRIHAIKKHCAYLLEVMPFAEMSKAVQMLISDRYFEDVLEMLDTLPQNVAAPLRAIMESTIANAPTGWIPLVEAACLLAKTDWGAGRERWHKFAVDIIRERDISKEPAVGVSLFRVCSEAERPALLETIRKNCATDSYLGLSELVQLLPALRPDEAVAFLKPWLEALHENCKRMPERLVELSSIPEPFATATLFALEDLLQSAPRTSILRVLAAWSPHIRRTQGQLGLRNLIDGVRAATETFP